MMADGRVSGENSILENFIIEIIKNIHKKKQRADKRSIYLAAKELTMEEVDITLDKLCETKVLKQISNANKESYRFSSRKKDVTSHDSLVKDQSNSSVFVEESGDEHVLTNTSNASEENLLLKNDIDESEHFIAFKNCLESIVDLKKYISFEMNTVKTDLNYLKLGHVDEQVKQLHEENMFLREEIRETRKLLTLVLENQNQTQAKVINIDVPNDNIENFEWSKSHKGGKNKWKSRNLAVNKNISNISTSNHFEVLSCDDFVKHQQAESDNEGTFPSTTYKIITPKRRPTIVVNNFPENQHDFSKNNVKTSYHKNNIKIMCDSIPKGIRTREFNRYVKNGSAQFKSFQGCTVKELHHYVLPTLNDEKPDTVIIHVGVNDLLNGKNPVNEIADEITDIGKTCREKGVKTIFISGIAFNKRIDYDVINRVNNDLKQNCDVQGFIYINNSEIFENDIWRDDLHLLESGKIILANNFISSLNKTLNKDFLWEEYHVSQT